MGSFEVKDSGARQSFDTGAVRDTNEGKGCFDLISPIFLKRLACQLQAGAAKYSSRNWEAGMPVTRCFDSAVRHLYSHLEGERSEDHLAAAAFNIMAIIHVEEMVKRGKLPHELVNWPNYLDTCPTPDTCQEKGCLGFCE